MREKKERGGGEGSEQGVTPGSSVRADSAFSHWALSPAPGFLFLIKSPLVVLKYQLVSTDHMMGITAGPTAVQEEVLLGLSGEQEEFIEGLSGVQEVISFLLHSYSCPGVAF